MRISSVFSPVVAFAALGAAHAIAFELKGLTDKTPPAEVLSYGMSQIKNGDKATAVEALGFAAEKGVPGAQWKLGDMYADGDGVPRDDYKAFELFSEVAAPRRRRQLRLRAVRLQRLRAARHLLPRRHPQHRREARPEPGPPVLRLRRLVFRQRRRAAEPRPHVLRRQGGDRDLIQATKWANLAADKGNPDAKLLLIDIWLTMAQDDLQADPPNTREAAKWARQASNSGSIEGQALLGYILFEGDGVTRQAVDGLTMLTIALERSGGKSTWIRDLHEQARAAATLDEWNAASQRADEWRASQAVASAARRRT